MHIETNFFEDLYLKARLSFKRCVMTPDNDYLKDEIDVPMDEIALIEDSICIKFYKYEVQTFLVEVKLQLLSKDTSLIGTYFYYEDESKTQVDDKLLFD